MKRFVLLFALLLGMSAATAEAGILGRWSLPWNRSTCNGTSCGTQQAAAPAVPTLADPNAPEVDADELSGAEQNLIQFVNAERAKQNLPPLVVCNNLMVSARRHCSWMAIRRLMQHTSAPVGECIAQGQRDSRDAMRTWMNSPPHRAHILSRTWTRVGVAGFVSPEGRLYWCLQFLR